MIQNSKHIDHCFDGGFYFFLMDLSQKHGELAYLWIFLTFYDHCRSKSAVAAEVCFEIEVVWDGNIFAELTQPLFIYNLHFFETRARNQVSFGQVVSIMELQLLRMVQDGGGSLAERIKLV